MNRAIRLIGVIVILLSAVPLGIAAYWYKQTDGFLEKAIKTEAIVVDVKERSSDEGTHYYPVFSFIDHSDEKHEIHSSWGSYPPRYEIGETTHIYYHPDNPKTIKLDSFVSLWLGPAILLGVGMIPVVSGALIIFVGPMITRAVNKETQRPTSFTHIEHQATMDQADEKPRMWAMLSHMTALSVFVGIPFGNILAPLVIWLMKKDVYPIVDAHGKESLNFQISMSLYSIVSLLLCFVLVGFILLPAIFITNLILVIVAGLRADKGEPYRYPLTLRFIK